MKRKPSKRNLHKKKLNHLKQNRSSWYLQPGVYISDYDTYTFTGTFNLGEGHYITLEGFNGLPGVTRFNGKNPKNVHPARRNKERKKWREECVITSSGKNYKIVKQSETLWLVDGEVV